MKNCIENKNQVQIILQILILFIGFLIPTYTFSQVNLESLSGVSKDGLYYNVTGDVLITQAINPIPLGVIRIHNGGRLRFGNNSSLRLGEVERDNGGNIIYNNDLKPVVKNRVYVLEQFDAGSFGVDNYNGSAQARFMNGCSVELEGVTWVIATTSRSDFDIKPGAEVHFRNSMIIAKTYSYCHFASTEVTIDGLTMDQRVNVTGLEFGLGNIPASVNNLNIVNNNPTSGSRHFVLVNFPGGTTYEMNRLQARNISLYSSSVYTAQLNNPIGNIKKGQFYNNILEVYRDLSLTTLNEDGTPATGTHIYLKRTVGDALTTLTTVNTNGTFKQRLLQYKQTHGSSTTSNQSNYDIYYANYNKLFKAQAYTLDYVEGLNGENNLGDIKLLDDLGITETNMATVAAYNGITINHLNKSITISDSISTCDLYDYLKYDKVVLNQDKPTVTSFVATKIETTLDLSDYSIILNSTGQLTACNLFEKIKTTGSSSISNLNDLKTALQDQTNTYKLIRLQGLTNGMVSVSDYVQDTIMTTFSEQSGTFSFVTNGNYTDIKVLVERSNYTDWGHVLDLSTKDVFSYTIFQAPKAFLQATKAQQEEMIYIVQKLLLKTQAIQNTFGNSSQPVPTFTINNYNTGIQATIENQVEMTRILKLLLKNNTSLQKTLQ